MHFFPPIIFPVLSAMYQTQYTVMIIVAVVLHLTHS